MNNSSILNAQNRFSWLDQLLNSNITPTAELIPYLKDLRSFCNLSVPGFFKKISYNTLQNATLNPKTTYTLNTNSRDRWELMKNKREQAYRFLLESFPPISIKEEIEPSPSEYRAQIRECLWHATQCSQAYLELFRDLKNFLDTTDNNSSNIDAIKLKNIFDKSRIRYLDIISSSSAPETLTPEPAKLRLIDGGKDA